MQGSKVYIYLAGTLICLIAIILVLTWGDEEKELLDQMIAAELKDQNEKGPTSTKQYRAVLDALKDEQALFSDKAVIWKSGLKYANEKLVQAKASLAAAQKISEAEQDEAYKKAMGDLTVAKHGRTEAQMTIAGLHTAMEKRLAFKKNRSTRVAAAQKKVEQAAALSLEDVKEKTQRAGLDWPEKKIQLDGWYQHLEKIMEQMRLARQTVQQENAKPDSQIQWAALIGAVEQIELSMEILPKDRESLLSRISQLYISWDKILVDMEIVEGYEVKFYHSYKLLKVTITDMAAKSSKHTTETLRVAVTKTDYEKNKNKLGMTLESKPVGKFDNEVEKTAQPPGYAYMASPSAGSNQFGRWQQSSSGSFWVWYGQYAFMRSLFGGDSGYRVYDRSWNDYDRSRRGGRSYYGSTGSGRNMYGSKGVYTQKRYSGSKYVKSGGFRRSNYVKSGGSYRGTRYSGSSYGSTGGSFRSRSYGSSSRFGGGK